MKKNIIFVTGFIGSDRVGLARHLAAQHNMEFVSLNEMIEVKDGRSILRIAMTMGEHEVRNKEYEALTELLNRDNLVVAVSDGIVLDDQCLSLLAQGTVVVADRDLSPQELWQKAISEAHPLYAFLSQEAPQAEGAEGAKETECNPGFQKFLELYHAREPIYRRIAG